MNEKLRQIVLEMHKHPEVRTKQKTPDCITIHANTYKCYGNAGIYRVEWIRQRIFRSDCDEVYISESSPEEITLCVHRDKFSEVLHDRKEFPD